VVLPKNLGAGLQLFRMDWSARQAIEDLR
jgi:hypothetical protein